MLKSLVKQSISNLFFPFYRLKEVSDRIAKPRALLYHSIGKEINSDKMGLRILPVDFKKQMQSLKDWGYEVLDISSIFNEAPFLKKTIILTFDDGYKDFITDVLPILEEFNYPVTVFVTIEYLQGVVKGRINGYWDSWDKMTWADLKSIKKNTKITIGSHGFSHKRLNRLNYDELFSEIAYSKEVLENELDKRIDLFAYSHGFYNEICQRILKEAEYKAAFSGESGLIEYPSNLYALKRTEINHYDRSIFCFRKKINGSYDWIRMLKNAEG